MTVFLLLIGVSALPVKREVNSLLREVSPPPPGRTDNSPPPPGRPDGWNVAAPRAAPVSVSCPAGQHDRNGACVCVDAAKIKVGDSCVDPAPRAAPVSVSCPAGQHDRNGACVCVDAAKIKVGDTCVDPCPAGQHDRNG